MAIIAGVIVVTVVTLVHELALDTSASWGYCRSRAISSVMVIIIAGGVRDAPLFAWNSPAHCV